MSFNAEGFYLVESFRSLKTSRIWVPDEEVWDCLTIKNKIHIKVLRETIKNINKYVNDNGGWTYIGWVRTGVVVDESDCIHKDVENIASETQDPHISYLWPSNPDIVSRTCAQYRQHVLTMRKLMDAENGAASVTQNAP